MYEQIIQQSKILIKKRPSPPLSIAEFHLFTLTKLAARWRSCKTRSRSSAEEMKSGKRATNKVVKNRFR